MPGNYKQQIDGYFAAALKDPGSRIIEYTRKPYGSLVCGTMNAKNSFGGYVGRQAFYAYFDQSGNILDVINYSSKDLEGLKWSSNSPQSKYYDQVVFFTDCGFLN